MQQLRATGVEIDVTAAVNAEHRNRTGRPWVLTNMVATIDGATALDGVSGGLGGPADKEMFGAIRSVPDIILVGGSTAREERYNPPLRPRPPAADHRAARGQAERPRLCVLTGSMHLEQDLPFLDDDPRPLVATTPASAQAADTALSARTELLDTGTELTVESVVAALGALGAETILCEGGPSLNAQMFAADLVDEICLTVSPLVAAGQSRRIAQGAGIEVPTSFTLDRTFTEDGFLFLRYLRTGAPSGS